MRAWQQALLSPWSGLNTLAYTLRVVATSPIVYFPQADTVGATVCSDASGNGRNGAYKGAGEPLLGVTGIGDGRTSAQYDGVDDFANIFTAGMSGAFNTAEGTVMVWSAGTASAGTAQRQINLSVDANNSVRIRWNAGTGTVTFEYIAGGTTKAVAAASAMAAGAAFACFALTWSKSADEVKAYKNGVQLGTTQTGLGVWAGSLSSTQCCIGAASTSSVSPFTGSQAHAALWASALSGATLASIMVV